jgi:hypothetical protein
MGAQYSSGAVEVKLYLGANSADPPFGKAIATPSSRYCQWFLHTRIQSDFRAATMTDNGRKRSAY